MFTAYNKLIQTATAGLLHLGDILIWVLKNFTCETIINCWYYFAPWSSTNITYYCGQVNFCWTGSENISNCGFFCLVRALGYLAFWYREQRHHQQTVERCCCGKHKINKYVGFCSKHVRTCSSVIKQIWLVFYLVDLFDMKTHRRRRRHRRHTVVPYIRTICNLVFVQTRFAWSSVMISSP